MSPSSPLRSIWFHPGETIAYIAHENPGYRLLVLPIAAGFVLPPTFAFFDDNSLDFNAGFVIGSLFAFGPVAEVLQVFIGAYLIRLTGGWLGGTASARNLQTVIAWGNVPIIAMSLLGVLVFISASVYSSMFAEPLAWGQTPFVLVIGWLLALVQVLLVGWSIAILVLGIAAIHGFSTGRALVSALLAWLITSGVIAFAMILIGHSDKVWSLFFSGFDRLAGLHGF